MNDVHRLGGGGRSGRLDGNVKIVIPPMITGMDKGGDQKLGENSGRRLWTTPY